MGLKRQVGLRTVVSTGAGLALASMSYVSLVELSGHVSGSAGWMALAVSGGICFLASLCFAELGGMFPSAAGIKLFIEKAYGEKAALLLATLYIMTTLSIVGAETFVLAHVLAYGVPGVPAWIWAVLFLMAIAWINVRGVKLTGMFQDVVAYFKFAALITLSWVALVKFGFPWQNPLQPFTDQGAGNFFQAVGIGVFLFLGFEWVTPLAEEVREYRFIPKGMAISILLLFLSYGSLITAMTSIAPKEELAQAVTGGNPIPHLIFAVQAFGPPGAILMIVMSLVASVTCFNAGMLTASRFLYALARDNAAPRVCARIHERYFTPHVAIWLLFAVCLAISIFVLKTAVIKPFIYLGALAECLIYVTMAASLLRLRRLRPEAERPFRVKSLVIPVLVAIFFSGLAIGLAWGQPVAAGAIAGAAILVALYVYQVVPRIRARAAAELAARAPRRRRRAG